MPEFDAFDPSYQEETVNFGQKFKDEKEVTEPEYAKEGIYHVVLSGVDASGKNFPGAIFLSFEILAGNVDDQIGKEIRFPIWPLRAEEKNPEAAKKRWQKTVLQLLLALKMRDPGEFPVITFTENWWNSLEGKQCIVKVTHTEKSGKTDAGKAFKFISAEIKDRGDLFAIGNEAIVGVPLDEQAATLGGYIGEADPDDIM